MQNRRAYALCIGLFGLLVCLTARADLWATNGSLLAARGYHTATLLPNGTVLIAGGFAIDADNPNGVFLASAELYDPTTGTCTNTGSMMVSRVNYTATLLNNGKVLVVGGRDGTNILSDAELYDPTTGTWTMTGTPQVPRSSHTATLLRDGTVLVAGGVVGSGSPVAATNSAELYNPATGTWSEVGSMSNVRFGHTATLLPNGQVLVAGGGDTNATPISSAEIYDPVHATWTATNSLNTARGGHTATLLPNGQVLVAGGAGVGFDNDLSSAEVFDPTTGIWTTTNSMNVARNGHTATLLPNGNLLVAGGYANPFMTNSAEIYNSASGTWTYAASMNFDRATQVATLLPSGKVLITGGYNENGYLASTETYDSTVNPATGAWSNTASMQNPRDTFTMTLLPNGKVLAAGGETFSGAVYSNAEIYDPVAETWTNTTAMNETRWGHTATLLPNGKVLVTGGRDLYDPFDPLSSAEIYDPSTEIWTETTPMSVGRYGATAVLLHNGKVLVVGGPGAELYDPSSETWSTTGPMIAPRDYPQTVLLTNGKVLVVGGDNVTIAELYDPTTGTWSAAGTLTLGVSSTIWSILLPGGDVLVGGEDTNHNQAAEVYDPNAGTWTNVQQPQTVFNAGATATLLPNGKVLVVGDFAGTNYTDTEVLFDPVTVRWMDGGQLNKQRFAHKAILLPNGKVLVAGGLAGATVTTIASAEVYDPGLAFSNAWRPQITSATSPLNLNGNLTVTGTGFQGISEASGGNIQNSSTDFPLVQLRSLESQQTTFLSTTNWSANSFTSLPVWNFPPGYALATVFVNGIQSTSSIVNISVPLPTMTTLTGAQFAGNGAFQFSFTNTPGAVLGILASTNLTLPLSNWTALSGVTEFSPGQFQFSDPQATNYPQQFYQLFAP